MVRGATRIDSTRSVSATDVRTASAWAVEAGVEAVDDDAGVEPDAVEAPADDDVLTLPEAAVEDVAVDVGVTVTAGLVSGGGLALGA